MVVETPDFDPYLDGHAAVTLDREEDAILHAYTISYPDGTREPYTECGKPVEHNEDKPRGEYSDSQVEHCDECWPDHLRE